MTSLIQSCRIKLNNVDVTPWPGYYNYKAYFEAVLTKSKRVQENALFTQGCYRDTPGSMDDLALRNFNYENAGLLTRVRHFAPSPEQDVNPTDIPQIDWRVFSGRANFIGRFPSDLDTLPLGILPGVGITIELTLATSEFYLMKGTTHSDETPKVFIEEVNLLMMIRDFIPDTYTRFMDLLRKQPCIQNFIQRRIYTFDVGMGLRQVTIHQFFAGQGMPTRCIMALVTEKAFIGSMDTNPYYFPRKFGPDGPTQSTLLKYEFTVDNCHVDGYTTTSSDIRLNAYMEYQRFLWLTAQTETNVYSTDINFYAFSEKGVFLPSAIANN
jgi:hypothetical protein